MDENDLSEIVPPRGQIVQQTIGITMATNCASIHNHLCAYSFAIVYTKTCQRQ
jgi:hypothetical protein